MRTLLYLLLAFTVTSPAQQTLDISALPGTGPTGGSASAIGAQGFQNIYYWVMARQPGGLSSSQIIVATGTVGYGNLSVSNYVQISWNAVPGATGYDVLTSSNTTYPSPCSACAVVLNTSALTVNDTGGVLSAYPPGGTNASVGATAAISLDNLSYINPAPIMAVKNSRYFLSMRMVGYVGAGPVVGHCAKFYDVLGNITTTGGVCNSGTISGTIAAGQVAYGTGVDIIGGSTGFLFSDAGGIRLMTLGGGASQSTNPLLDITDSAGSSHWLTVLGDGKVGIGTVAPSVKFDVNGLVRVYDQTASTGATTLEVRAGAGQSSTALLDVTSNLGSNHWLQVRGDGVTLFGSNIALNGNLIQTASAVQYVANAGLQLNNVTHTAAISGVGSVRITPTYNTSGTSVAFTDLLINRTETSLGTTPGAQYLLDAQVGGVSKFSADRLGAVFATGLKSSGTKFTASGCSNSATVGGATAGTYTSGTTGTCTVTITMNGATGLTAPNGWACSASDLTTPANLISQSATTTTTATLTGTTVSGDVISFLCMGY